MRKVFCREKWKDIVGYENIYKISSSGHVYNIKTKKLMKTHLNRGYLRVTLTKDGERKSYYVHVLVAEHFIAVPDKYKNAEHLTVNHRSGYKNNNSSMNLEWLTQSENNFHAFKHGLNFKGELHAHSVLTEPDVRMICELLSTGNYSVPEIVKIVREFNPKVSRNNIRRIYDRVTWKDISKDYIFPRLPDKNRKYSDEIIHKICRYLEKGKSIMFIIDKLNLELHTGRCLINDVKSKRNHVKISDQYKI